eukprot:6174097-Pyramimonas_sp.AAC.2
MHTYCERAQYTERLQGAHLPLPLNGSIPCRSPPRRLGACDLIRAVTTRTDVQLVTPRLAG